MDRFELVEKLVKSTGVSFAEAKKALEASGWDLLDAAVWLEKNGTTEEKTSHFTTNPEQQEEELIPEQINPIEQTGNEVTQEAIDKPTVETIPELPALNAWVSANQRSVFASDGASFTLRYEGAELAAVRVVATQGDDVIYESDAFEEKVTVPTASAHRAGEIILMVTVVMDWPGQCLSPLR